MKRIEIAGLCRFRGKCEFKTRRKITKLSKKKRIACLMDERSCNQLKEMY